MPFPKLPAGASEDEHLGLLVLLNSSVACFWLQQVCHNKGGPGGGSSKDEKWHDFYAFNSTKVAEFPLVTLRPFDLARKIDTLAQSLSSSLPRALLVETPLPTRASLAATRDKVTALRRQMITLQEEMDWHCYRLYGLLNESLEFGSPPEIDLGERAFEIVMARRIAEGSLQTKWFEWLHISPKVNIPPHWPAGYQAVVQRRISLIEADRNIALIESPGCKRRWESTSWESLEQAALRDWLLARLESPALWPASTEQPPQITTTRRLTDRMQRDPEFMQIAALYASHADFDPGQLVADLVASEAVPFLPVLRYSESGLRKRAQWEDTWSLQRREDAGEELTGSVGRIPVPPKYQSKDFLKSDFWRLRGGLDVPKERWISYPGCERGADGSLVIAWAGWDHLQQATALATCFIDMKEREGWARGRLQPLLAGLLELLPWLRQWHNDMNPDFGARMGDYYAAFVSDEARALQCTLDDLRAWKPPTKATRRGRKQSA